MKQKDTKELMEIIQPYGYTIIQTKKHRKIIDKEGKIIYSMSSTPSDRNFHRQVLRDLRRLGLLNDTVDIYQRT